MNTGLDWTTVTTDKLAGMAPIVKKNLPYFGFGNLATLQPTGHQKCSAMPTLFPSPGGHPTDVPFLGDFC